MKQKNMVLLCIGLLFGVMFNCQILFGQNNSTYTTSPNESSLKAGDVLVQTVNNVEYRFRWCPSGKFVTEGEVSGAPLRTVELDGFWILETEVTVQMFRSFVIASEFESKGFPAQKYDSIRNCMTYEDLPSTESWKSPGFNQLKSHPVTCVSGYDAGSFADWLGKQLGVECDMPSHIEWKYACKTGSTTAFSFGDSESELYLYGNYYDKSCPIKGIESSAPPVKEMENETPRKLSQDMLHTDGYAFTSPVRSFKPNRWGIYDMHGNVYERTSTAFMKPGSRDISEVLEYLCGGSWVSPSELCNAECSIAQYYSRNMYTGFRVVLKFN